MTVPEISKPFPVYAGDVWEQPLRFTIEDPAAPDAPREPEILTGWSGWEAQWRRSASSSRRVTLSVVVTDPLDGIVTLTATGEQVREMGGGGVFDVQAVKSGIPRTFVRGRTTWDLDVTRND